MAKTRTLTNVPASKVDDVVQQFEAEGAVVTKTKQPNGKYTVVAVFPDKKKSG